MPWSAVLDLARTRITLAEMRARTGIRGVRLEKLMEEAGCPRLDRLGWMRKPALATLRRIAPDVGSKAKARAVPRAKGM